MHPQRIVPVQSTGRTRIRKVRHKVLIGFLMLTVLVFAVGIISANRPLKCELSITAHTWIQLMTHRGDVRALFRRTLIAEPSAEQRRYLDDNLRHWRIDPHVDVPKLERTVTRGSENEPLAARLRIDCSIVL